MKNIKTSILALAFLSISGLSVLSMEEDNDLNNKSPSVLPYEVQDDVVQLRITRSKIRSTSPLFVFKLPDESQVSTNSSNEVWVKELNYTNTRWKDYAQRNGLRIKAIVETGDVDEVKLSIKRLSRSFFLPGGYEVAVNGGDEVWVKEPSREGYTSPGYYATPFNVFSERVGLIAKPVIRYEN